MLSYPLVFIKAYFQPKVKDKFFCYLPFQESKEVGDNEAA